MAINRLLPQRDTRLSDDGTSTAQAAKELVAEQTKALTTHTQRLTDKATEFVKDHPTACIATALLTGILLGVWIKRT